MIEDTGAVDEPTLYVAESDYLMQKRLFVFLFVAVLSVGALAYAQTDTPTQAEITFPPPVTLVRGIVPIEGTANVPNQSVFFVQFRELNPDLTPVGGEDALWSPATPLRRDSVTDGVLGEWDTTEIEDGIYQLQLVVNLTGGEPVRATVAAIRVLNDNTDPAFEGALIVGTPLPTPDGTVIASVPTATATLPLVTRPDLQPTPTALIRPTSTNTVIAPGSSAGSSGTTSSNQPTGVTVTGAVQANVRLGDSTSYPAVGVLNQGQTAPVLAQSNRSSWLLIRLPNGTEGYLSPSTVIIDGDVFNLPQVQPPPLPFTPTPVATATFTPAPAVANLFIDSIDLSPDNPDCGETFTINAIIRNNGTGPTTRSGTVNVVDRTIDSDRVNETTVGGFPVLNANEQFEMRIPITVSDGENDDHRIEILIDPSNEIPETNEGDNFATDEYELQESDDC